MSSDLGFVCKGEPQQCRGEADEAKVGAFALAVPGSDAAPVLELVEQTPDLIAQAIFPAVMEGWRTGPFSPGSRPECPP